MFAILVANNQLVTLIRPKKYSLHPSGMNGKNVSSFCLSSPFLPETSDTTDHAMVNKGLFYSSSLLINQPKYVQFYFSVAVESKLRGGAYELASFQRDFHIIIAMHVCRKFVISFLARLRSCKTSCFVSKWKLTLLASFNSRFEILASKPFSKTSTWCCLLLHTLAKYTWNSQVFGLEGLCQS